MYLYYNFSEKEEFLKFNLVQTLYYTEHSLTSMCDHYST